MQDIKIDLVSDVNCPWCYLGEARLKKAMEATAGKYTFSLHFKPFELNPQAPEAGELKETYFKRNYGPDSLERLAAGSRQLAELGKQEGISFNFDQSTVIHNTFKAHRLIWLAETYGCQAEVATALFEANFTEGSNVNDSQLLKEIGQKAGIPAERLENFFESQEGVTEVRSLESWAQQAGISGVPAFIFNDKYLVSGAQPTETLLQVFSQLEKEALATESGNNSCSVEGNC